MGGWGVALYTGYKTVAVVPVSCLVMRRSLLGEVILKYDSDL